MLLLYFWDKTYILTSMFIYNKQLQIWPYLVGFSHDPLHIDLGEVFTIRSGMVKNGAVLSISLYSNLGRPNLTISDKTGDFGSTCSTKIEPKFIRLLIALCLTMPDRTAKPFLNPSCRFEAWLSADAWRRSVNRGHAPCPLPGRADISNFRLRFLHPSAK